MTKSCIKFLVESDSAIESAFPWHCGQYRIGIGRENDDLALRISAFTHALFIGLQGRFLASLEMTIRESDVF